MSDVIYVENDNGLNVSINEMETEINPEGYIFVRNGEKEIEAYVQDIVKPDLALYSQNKQNDIENTLNSQVDAARVQLNNFTNSECQTYISQTCQDKKNEIAQFAEQSQNAYASFVEEKNLEVENIVAQANAAAESATNSKNAAASSATSSSNYSNNSKVWAEGSDSQVQALGGTHSAKGWANLVNDSVLVHKIGNETIAGDKTFTGNIIPSSVLFKSKTGGANQGFLYQNSSGNLYFGLRNSGNTEFMNNFSFAPDGSITVSIGNSATNKAFIVPNPATSDNSAKAATTNWVRSLLNTLYSVGSLFFSTAGTCPLQSLGIGTWNKVGTSLTLSVNTSVPVKGTGLSLGLNNGSQNVGITGYAQAAVKTTSTHAYGVNIGTNASSNDGNYGNALGVTTDSSKSGIAGTVTRTQITVNVFQRTA